MKAPHIILSGSQRILVLPMGATELHLGQGRSELTAAVYDIAGERVDDRRPFALAWAAGDRCSLQRDLRGNSQLWIIEKRQSVAAFGLDPEHVEQVVSFLGGSVVDTRSKENA